MPALLAFHHQNREGACLWLRTALLPGWRRHHLRGGRNIRLDFGSNAIVLALSCVWMSPTDSYSSGLFWWITDIVPSPFEQKINLLSASKATASTRVPIGRVVITLPVSRIHHRHYFAAASNEKA